MSSSAAGSGSVNWLWLVRATTAAVGSRGITVPKGTPVLPTSESQKDFTAAPSLRQLWSARSPFPLLKFRGKLKPFLELYKNKNIRSW